MGVGNGLMDAQPEWHNITRALTRAPRRLLTGADVATVRRARAALARWGSATIPARPLAAATTDQLRRWHAEERAAANEKHRRPRYILTELACPPLALGRLASHQEDKYPANLPSPTNLPPP